MKRRSTWASTWKTSNWVRTPPVFACWPRILRSRSRSGFPLNSCCAILVRLVGLLREVLTFQSDLLGKTRCGTLPNPNRQLGPSLHDGAIEGADRLQAVQKIGAEGAQDGQLVDLRLSQLIGDQEETVFQQEVLFWSQADRLAGLQFKDHDAVVHELIEAREAP